MEEIQVNLAYRWFLEEAQRWLTAATMNIKKLARTTAAAGVPRPGHFRPFRASSFVSSVR